MSSQAVVSPAAEPTYSRIKRYVLEHIRSGSWKHGDRVPSESALVRRFKVSRMTAHRAMRELAAERVLTRVQGLGTFVAEPKIASTVVAIRSIHNEIEARGHRHTCKALKREIVPLAKTDAPLTLPGDARLLHALVLHCENGIPIQLEDRFVNPAIAPEFLKQDFSAVAPGDYLMSVAPITRAEHSIEAVMPNKRVARLLSLSAGEPCLLLTRLTWSGDLPATFARLYHPGSRYRLTAEIQ